jgi:hypothetical protein
MLILDIVLYAIKHGYRHGHDTDTDISIPIIIWKNDIIQRNYKCPYFMEYMYLTDMVDCVQIHYSFFFGLIHCCILVLLSFLFNTHIIWKKNKSKNQRFNYRTQFSHTLSMLYWNTPLNEKVFFKLCFILYYFTLKAFLKEKLIPKLHILPFLPQPPI